MKALSVAGTAAMFLVGGSILTHGVTMLHRRIESWTNGRDLIPALDAIVDALLPMLFNMAIGIAAGALAFVLVAAIRRSRRQPAPRPVPVPPAPGGDA
jgi:predicted DNA repair protein MutK